MNTSVIHQTDFYSSQEHRQDPADSQERFTEWRETSLQIFKTAVNLGSFFICGAALLCLMATWQKFVIGAPMVVKGYIVPFVFGGFSGACIGYYITRLRGLNSQLLERVDTLESFMSLCSGCGKIREPETKLAQQDFWLPIETYLSERIGCSVSHGMCPECLKRLYPEEAEAILLKSSQIRKTNKQ